MCNSVSKLKKELFRFLGISYEGGCRASDTYSTEKEVVCLRKMAVSAGNHTAMDVNIMDIWLSEIQCYRTYDVLFQAISI
jgi:hypothetical protein